jgi:hypothetical protein
MLADADDTVLTQDEIEKYLALTTPTIKYKVYFDTSLGYILSITNEIDNRYTSCVELDEIEVSEFLSGKKDFTKCKIAYNESSQPYIVEPDVYNNVIQSFLKIDYDGVESSVIVENYINENKWGIKISEQERDSIKKHQINTRLDFYVTLKNNSSLLVRTLSVDLLDLANHRRLFVPYEDVIESKNYLLSVYTKKFFPTYSRIEIK